MPAAAQQPAAEPPKVALTGLAAALQKAQEMGFEGLDMTGLPKLKKGILNPASELLKTGLSPERIREINVVYAKDYRVFNDLLIITRNFRKI